MLLGLAAAPLCATAWLSFSESVTWGGAWAAGSLAWPLLTRSRPWVRRVGAGRYGGQGQVLAGAATALAFQTAAAVGAPPALWLTAIALHACWLALASGRGALAFQPTLVAVGSGRITDLKKLLDRRVQWAELEELGTDRVDAVVFDRHSISDAGLVALDPSIWCHRTFDATRVLEDLEGRISLADWSSDRLAELGRNRCYRALKRALDLTLVLLSLPIVAPIAGLIALMIRLDSPGPILFRQQRTGLGGQPFQMLKFRSMTVSDDHVAAFTQREDQRITRVGRLIRAKRLDELPQLLNVLSGSMSLVGPRPEQVPFVEQLLKDVPPYHLRHGVKPGITGWAQLEQGYVDSLDDTVRKLEYDLYYATRRSLALDIEILFRTIPAVLRGVEAEGQSERDSDRK